MRNPQSEKWIWAVGLVTAATAFFSPADAPGDREAADRGDVADMSEGFGDDARPRAVVLTPQLEETLRAPGNAPATLAPHTAAPLERLGRGTTSARSASLLLHRPGPPVYLVAPRQSPPHSTPTATS